MVYIAGTTQEEEIQELQQENTHLKAELQALRELLKEIEFVDSFDWQGNEIKYCPICMRKWNKHKEGCRLKAELDKMEGVK